MECARLERSSEQRSRLVSTPYIHLGMFTRARDAAMAYDEAIVELSGKSIDELKLNFPDGMSEVE